MGLGWGWGGEPYPQLRLLEVVQRQGLEVVGARVVLHHRELGAAGQNAALPSHPPDPTPAHPCPPHLGILEAQEQGIPLGARQLHAGHGHDVAEEGEGSHQLQLFPVLPVGLALCSEKVDRGLGPTPSPHPPGSRWAATLCSLTCAPVIFGRRLEEGGRRKKLKGPPYPGPALWPRALNGEQATRHSWRWPGPQTAGSAPSSPDALRVKGWTALYVPLQTTQTHPGPASDDACLLGRRNPSSAEPNWV